MQIVNLDTHLLLFALDDALTAREHDILSSNTWGISCIVLWEIAKLTQLGRIDTSLDEPKLRSALDTLHIWPIDLQTARTSTQLDFSGDPADELIAATSVVQGVPLLTRDRQILQSKMVSFAQQA